MHEIICSPEPNVQLSSRVHTCPRRQNPMSTGYSHKWSSRPRTTWKRHAEGILYWFDVSNIGVLHGGVFATTSGTSAASSSRTAICRTSCCTSGWTTRSSASASCRWAVVFNSLVIAALYILFIVTRPIRRPVCSRPVHGFTDVSLLLLNILPALFFEPLNLSFQHVLRCIPFAQILLRQPSQTVNKQQSQGCGEKKWEGSQEWYTEQCATPRQSRNKLSPRLNVISSQLLTAQAMKPSRYSAPGPRQGRHFSRDHSSAFSFKLLETGCKLILKLTP